MKFLSNYFIGLVLVVIGHLLKTYPPEHVNDSIGYRTKFAMKNKDTWYEANRFAGIMLNIGGYVFIFISIVIDYLYGYEKSLSVKMSKLSLAVIGLTIILSTEIHLRKSFDKNGVRK